MIQITTQVPESIASALDEVALQQGRSRADLVRGIIEQYLEDLDDVSTALRRLQDPLDPVEDWDEVRRVLLDKPTGRTTPLPPDSTPPENQGAQSRSAPAPAPCWTYRGVGRPRTP